ncbi:hypothetical protein L8106_17902, partial [Lyngbya sp. PCC 8106]
MALTSDEENKIRQLLARESEQKRSQILSSAQSFAKWSSVAATIAINAKEIVE